MPPSPAESVLLREAQPVMIFVSRPAPPLLTPPLPREGSGGVVALEACFGERGSWISMSSSFVSSDGF